MKLTVANEQGVPAVFVNNGAGGVDIYLQLLKCDTTFVGSDIKDPSGNVKTVIRQETITFEAGGDVELTSQFLFDGTGNIYALWVGKRPKKWQHQ